MSERITNRRRWLRIAAVGSALAVVTVTVTLLAVSADDDCTRRGGHLETTSWIWVGKVLVPVDTCVGAR